MVRIVAALLLCSALLSAQDAPERRPPPSIRTTAEGVVSARPDQAEIDLAVVTQAGNAQEAASQNAARADAVVAALKKAAGAGGEVRTIGYSLQPDYRYPGSGGGKPTIVGYTARNVVQVKTTELAGTGKLIDAALQAGANNVQRLSFTLKNEQSAKAQALREAAQKARADADALAAALGLKIVRVLSVEAGGPGVIRPVMEMAMMRAAGPAEAPQTPVEPGTIEIRQNVTLMVEVSQ
jgi:uncharacterized protein YggE